MRHHAGLSDWFNQQVRTGRIATCDVVVLELLRSARDTAAFRTQAGLLDLLDRCPIGAAELDRAKQVQRSLAERGRRRGIPPADLLIAAAAESAGTPVLHYDHDYDLISQVSGQVTRWLVPAGSLP